MTRAEEQTSLLLEKGMGETLLDDIRAQVGALESAWEEGRVGRTDHIGARADRELIIAEIMDLAKVLDGMNRIRFGSNPEEMAVDRREAPARDAAGRGGARPCDGGGSGE